MAFLAPNSLLGGGRNFDKNLRRKLFAICKVDYVDDVNLSTLAG